MVGLTSLRTRTPPMLPKLNRKRALFEFSPRSNRSWLGNEGLKPSGIPGLLNWDDTCVKCVQVSTGGWRH